MSGERMGNGGCAQGSPAGENQEDSPSLPHRSVPPYLSLHLQLVFLGVRWKDHPLLDSSATDLKEIL